MKDKRSRTQEGNISKERDSMSMDEAEQIELFAEIIVDIILLKTSENNPLTFNL